jgi:uncharacterized repeat protein (TIGR03847 family)
MSFFAEFEHVDVLTTGAVGVPGRRTFYLQARMGNRTVTVRCEKQQAAAISQYLRRALKHLPVPEGQPPRNVMNLTEPIDEAFVLGAVALEFNRSGDHFVLHLREFAAPDEGMDDDVDDEDDEAMSFDPDDDDENAGSRVRVSLNRAQAMAFCEHTDRVVSAGRPACVYCERPVDPDGHFCPRMN